MSSKSMSFFWGGGGGPLKLDKRTEWTHAQAHEWTHAVCTPSLTPRRPRLKRDQTERRIKACACQAPEFSLSLAPGPQGPCRLVWGPHAGIATRLCFLTSSEAQLARGAPRPGREERVSPAHAVPDSEGSRVQELSPGSTCARPGSSSGVERAWWLRPGAGLGGLDASAYLAAAAPGERRALRPGTAGAEAGCGRDPRGLQMAPPTLPAHPGAEAAPIVSRRRRPRQPVAAGVQDHPPEPRPESGSPPPHARADERTQSLPSLSRQPQLRPPPTGRGRGLKDTLTPPQLSRRFQRARFRDSFLRPLALRLEENSG